MLTVQHPMSQVRVACTENNFTWLRGFGCHIEARGPWWRVWHKDLPEYRALLVLRECAPASTWELEAAAADAVRDGIAVYVDAGSSPGWGHALAKRGYAMTFQSCVRVVTVSKRRTSGPLLRMRQIGMAEVEAWKALYAQVFDRPPMLAAVEGRRWRAAFGKAELQHYLYEREGVAAGICELCVDDSVAGLYSVGFLKAARSLLTLRQAAQMVRDAVRAQGLQLMYFERARKLSATPGESQAPRHIVRTFDAWTPTS